MKLTAMWTMIVLLCLAHVSVAQQAPHPSVTLNWSFNQGTGDPATGFNVKRSVTPGGPYTLVTPVGASSLTYLDVTVAVGGTYYYVVTATNSGGESANSNEVKCTLPFLAPGTPGGLSGTVR